MLMLHRRASWHHRVLVCGCVRAMPTRLFLLSRPGMLAQYIEAAKSLPFASAGEMSPSINLAMQSIVCYVQVQQRGVASCVTVAVCCAVLRVALRCCVHVCSSVVTAPRAIVCRCVCHRPSTPAASSRTCRWHTCWACWLTTTPVVLSLQR